MTNTKLNANKRSSLGRKVKQLRQKGILPGNIYGNKIKSQVVEVSLTEFRKVFQKAGETKIVDLVLNKEVHPVLIHNIQVEALSGNPIHTDFYQVDLKQKVKTKVPVKLTGKSSAVEQKLGLLLQTLNEVEIEALPADLPETLTLDVSSLTALDQELKVKAIKVPSGVTLLTETNLGVVKIGRLVSKEAEQLVKEEEAASAAAKAASAQAAAASGTVPSTQPAEKPEATEKVAPSTA